MARVGARLRSLLRELSWLLAPTPVGVATTTTAEVCMSLTRSSALAQRVTIAGVAVILFAATAAAAGLRPHDPDLDLADAALEKAEGLLQLTNCGIEGTKGTKECEKAVAKALADLADARAEIALAAAAADGGAANGEK